MAWRPYENLIDGELDNRTPGKITGWMCFHRRDAYPLRVTFNLLGDFHEDIRGKVVRFSNPRPSDRNEAFGRPGTYMKGFAAVQEGEAGDMTAGRSLGPWSEELASRLMEEHEISWDIKGLSDAEREERRRELEADYRKRIAAQEPFYAYVPYPYFEWYSEANGRVVLELDSDHVRVVHDGSSREKKAKERREARRQREDLLIERLGGVVPDRRKNGEEASDGNVFDAFRS